MAVFPRDWWRKRRHALSKLKAGTVASIEAGVPLPVVARETVAGFQAIIRNKRSAALELWLDQARSSLVASSTSAVVKDNAAVKAAITSPSFNSRVEN